MLQKIYERLRRKGQGVVEYALLLGVVAVLVVGFVSKGGLTETFGKTLKNVVGHFTTFNEAYENADANNNSEVTQDAGASEDTDSGDGNDLDDSNIEWDD